MGQSPGSRAASPWTAEQIGRLVSPGSDPADTLANIVQLVQARFASDACSLYLLESERATLVLSAAVGLNPDSVGRTGVRVGEGPIGVVAEGRAPQVHSSFIGVPVLHRTLLQGVLIMQARPPRAFTADEGTQLLASVAQLTPFISHARAEARRRLECRLVEQAKAQLLATLAAGLAHELNNKLMPITSYAELMLDEVDAIGSDDLKEACATIRESAFEAADVLERLVHLSTTTPAAHGPCDLAAVVRKAAESMQPLIESAGVRVTLAVSDGPLALAGDAEQLHRLCVNLIDNAIEAMTQAVTRDAIVKLDSTPGGAVLSVSDTGVGIAADILPRIFDPYFTTKDSRGEGTGLSICYGVVKQHGGDIKVVSKVGQGTTFQVTLPTRPGARISVSDDAAIATPVARFEARRVLVIDDDERMLDLVAAMLESKLGCRVERARNGLDATSALQRSDFDLVVSDVRMPLMDGVELLEWIAVNQPSVLRRTMFMTGDATPKGPCSDIQRAGRPLLRKPFSLDALVNTATRVIGSCSA